MSMFFANNLWCVEQVKGPINPTANSLGEGLAPCITGTPGTVKCK